MSVPFSNTHLRVPRGFGTILNGLVREILRDQPEDIPKYAAQYFSSLLQQRQESGMDPAEWAASLEDRYYDMNTFRDTEVPATEGLSGTKKTTPKEKSQTGEESSHSREVSSFSAIQPLACEGANLSASEENEGEKDDVTNRHTPTDKLYEGESLNRELDTDEPSGAAEQDPSRTLDSADEKDISHVSHKGVDHPASEFTGISSGFSEDVACASSPTAAEDEGSDQEEVLGKDLVDSNETTEAEEQAEVFPHSGVPDVDVSAADVEVKESTTEGSAATDDRQEGDEKPQHEDTSFPLSQNLKSETERPEDDQPDTDDQAEATEGMERLQTCSEETHEEFSNMEGSNTHKGDSLVEVSFEDVPEAQEIKESEERQPEEPDTVEILQTHMEMPPVEESKEIAAVAPDQNVSVTQGRGEHEMVGVELEVNSEKKEMESQQEVPVMKERADTNDSNLSDEEDEMGEADKVVSSSDQPTGAIEKVNTQHEQVHEISLKMSEGESQQKDASFEDAEPTDVQKGDEEDDSQQWEGGENQSNQQATQSSTSTGAPETGTETSRTSPQHLSEGDNGGQRTSVEAEREVTLSEKEASESLETVGERKFDSGKQEDSETMFVKDIASPDPPADGGENGHLEKDTAGPEDGSGEKQEDCSRPQEEEDIMDIPLDDPEANRAAAKIQAGFRGHMTRKKLKPEDKAEGEERQEDRGQ